MHKCDLVMKGGITSGVVYPGAVCELAKDFQFASIGGTSAGAIAAALTAAAEYRRQNGSSAGFEELETLPHWLAGGEGKVSRLLALFRPHEDTAGLMALTLAYIETPGTPLRKTAAATGALMRHFNRLGGAVLAVGALFSIISTIAAALLWDVSRAASVSVMVTILLVMAASAVAFLLAAVLEAVLHAIRVLPRHGFGVCSGMSESGEALTSWLTLKIGELAGLDRPLTFGDLKKHGIRLSMITTNLTHGRPYGLPFETRQFHFAPSEMRRLFPEAIVRWMVDHAPEKKPRPKNEDGEELFPLPAADDLPVVVATRMSLSFPILLSAVPLWAFDFGRKRERPRPERCWFSDGGITSNFPVHFFDKPLPRWPTFAFNLAEWTPRYHREKQSVYVPRTNRDGILEWWEPIGTLWQFLKSIANTMQNWRDNMLLHLPGQRDRIAHVLLAHDEGGLNLTMDPPTIDRVAAKGREAASELRARFAGTPAPGVTLTWTNHKWVRFMAFMPALEETLESWSAAFTDTTSSPAFEDLVGGKVPLPSYKVRPPDREVMHATSLAFAAHVREVFGAKPFRRVARRPRPEPVLRAMPRE